jgi:hypothetical protein
VTRKRSRRTTVQCARAAAKRSRVVPRLPTMGASAARRYVWFEQGNRRLECCARALVISEKDKTRGTHLDTFTSAACWMKSWTTWVFARAQAAWSARMQ